MAIELVAYDIAGTTVTDKGNINDFFRKAFSNEGIVVDAADVDDVMGYRKRDAIQIRVDKYSPGLENSDEVVDNIHEDFTRSMVEFNETCAGLSPPGHIIDSLCFCPH